MCSYLYCKELRFTQRAGSAGLSIIIPYFDVVEILKSALSEILLVSKQRFWRELKLVAAARSLSLSLKRCCA